MNLLSRFTAPSVEVERSASSGWSPLDPWALQPNWLYGSMSVRAIDQPEAFEDFVGFVHEQDNVVSAAVVARAHVMSQVRFAWRNTIRANGNYRQLFGTPDLALLERPDPGVLTRPQLLHAAETQASYAGAAYIVRHRDRLELLDPGLVDVVLMGVDDRYQMLVKRAGVKIGYLYWRGGRYGGEPAEQYDLDEVIHFTPEPNPLRWWTGTSWVSSLLQEVSLDKASTRYLREFFEKAATPNLIVKPHDSLTPENVDLYREIFAKEYAGVRNSFKTMWLGGGSDVTVVGSKLADLDLKSLQGGLETRVAARSRVPAAILGIREGLGGSALNSGNYAATRRLWADGWFSPSVQSLCAAVESAFPPPAGAEMWHDTADVLLLQEDAQDAAQIMATQATALQALDSAGYSADAAVAAVRDGNLSALIGAHDGLQSVQRQPSESGTKGLQTMSDILRRAWSPHLDLEIRGDGRTVYGLAVPYDTPTPIRDRAGSYDEIFRMGSFADTIRERGDRVKFLANHDRQTLPLGKAISLREDTAGLIGEFRVSATSAGDAALELIRDGVLDALSVGFVPIEDRGSAGRDPIVERLAVKLMEVSAVAFPAYEGALISGVRNVDGPDQPDETPEPDQLEAPDQRIHRARATALLDIDTLIRKVNR